MKFSQIVLSIVLSLFVVLPVFADETPWWQRDTRQKRNAESTLSKTRVEQVPIPILFGFDVADVPDDFGVPRSGGRTHEGIDFITPDRAPIISPTDAVVRSTGEGPSAGLYVYTHNPGGEVFAYLHLDEIAPGLSRGDQLKKGDLIGFVGNTGNASATLPHLHFEIRADVALDPHPRVTATFSAFEKMQFLQRMFDMLDSNYETELSTLIALEYEDEMRAAQAMGIVLPSSVEAKLGNVTAEDLATITIPSTSANNPSIGSEGVAITSLQTYLINTNIGPAAQNLAGVGATGYFGVLTETALAEYQRAFNLPRTDGVYDNFTREYIAYISGGIVSATPTDTPTQESTTASEASPTQSVDISGMPQFDMTIGRRGGDVVWLQEFLIAKDTGNAAQSLAAVGATGYYGTLTANALAEYQKAAGISPASGYFGELTRTYILIHS